MAPSSDDMPDLDRPVTLRDLHALRTELRSELQGFATKEELRTSIESLRTEMATGFAEMRGYVDFSVKSSHDELRTHFDVIAESLRADFRSMFDWMKANLTSVTNRVEALETGHGARLSTLEARVTKLEIDRN
jgi:hypothetical protein